MGLIILERTDKAKFLSPSIALLIGAMVRLALARDKMQDISIQPRVVKAS